MNREQLLELNDMSDGSLVKFMGEPTIIEDVNGMPIGMDATPVHWAKLDGVTVTAAEVRDAGLTPADLPNLNVSELA